MSLGFDAIAALPFATSGPDNSVNVVVTKNALTISIGSVGIIADSIVEDPDPNRLALGLGTLTISGKANVSLTGSQVSLGISCFRYSRARSYYVERYNTRSDNGLDTNQTVLKLWHQLIQQIYH